MRIAVLGAGGQLGRDLCPRLGGDVMPLTRDRVDLTRLDTLRTAFAEIKPDMVINCAAYNLVDQAESDPQTALSVNTLAVRELARLCRDCDCTLVHFSTDYVFGIDESRRQPWSESDAPGPVNAYGLSKLAGEYFVRSICPRHYVIRTCGLYGLSGSGGKGGNFVETMLRCAELGKPLRVVADQVCTPTSTVALADAVTRLIVAGPYGLYHLTCGGECSWHDFAATIFHMAEISAQLEPIASKDRNDPARRPVYSVLANEANRRAGLPPLPTWQEALAAYLRQRATARPH